MAQVSRGRRLMGEINVVPYIDVMLVLLIIFMITAPLLTQGVKVSLPHAAAKTLSTGKRSPIVLSVTRSGGLYLAVGTRPAFGPASANDIESHVAAALQSDPTRPVMIRADTAVSYGVIVRAMVLLQDAGARKVGFMTQPPAGRPNP